MHFVGTEHQFVRAFGKMVSRLQNPDMHPLFDCMLAVREDTFLSKMRSHPHELIIQQREHHGTVFRERHSFPK